MATTTALLFGSLLFNALIWSTPAVAQEAIYGPEAAKRYVDQAVGEHPVTVFSKTYCRDWPPVKQIFDTYHLSEPYEPHVINLNLEENMFAIQNYLTQKTGTPRVPNVFINNQSAGDGDHVAMLYMTGKLTNMLREAGAKV